MGVAFIVVFKVKKKLIIVVENSLCFTLITFGNQSYIVTCVAYLFVIYGIEIN